MAKTYGGIRNSKWTGDIFSMNGKRLEYYELPDGRKTAVKLLAKKIATSMYRRLKEKVVTLDAGGAQINVQFTKSGIDHVARDSMIMLSGKYMSRRSMVHIDEILAKSEYVPTNHAIYKERNDGKTMFFRYKDSDGRGIYFKVAKDNASGKGDRYYLYSVTDK